MTDWNDPVDTQTDPGAPPVSEMFKRFDYNVIAALEGSSGAPRMAGEAVARASDGLEVITVSASSAHIAANSSLLAETGDISISGESTTVVAMTYTMDLYDGSMRFTASHTNSVDDNGDGTSTLYLYKNDSWVASWANNTDDNTENISYDLSVSEGDTVQWRHTQTGGSTAQGARSIVENMYVYADDPYQEVIPLIRASNQ